MKKTLLKLIAVSGMLATMSTNVNAQSWSLTGNAGTDPSINFIGTTDNKAFKIRTKNVVRVNVAASGNVGIGTTAPTQKLEVNGTVYSTSGGFKFPDGTTQVTAATGAAGANLQLSNLGTTAVNASINPNTTNTVSLGTATNRWANLFGSNLDIRSSNSLVASFDGGNGTYISFLESGASLGYIGSFSGAAADVDFGTVAGNTAGAVNFTIQANPKMTITSAGNVGIGTSSPTAPLQVSSNSTGTTPQFLLYETDNDYARMNFQNNTGSSYWAIGGYNNATKANERFSIYNSKAAADLFVITGNGKVSIGTNTTPLAKLDVTDHSIVGLLGNFDGGNNMYMALKENGAYRGYIGSYSGAAEDVDFGTGDANLTGAVNFTIQAIPKMTITSTGNVGVGTTTPGYKLDVCGAMRAKEVRVETGWCDYVFANDYKLAPLSDVESYIKTNKHLPDVTPGSEIESNGLEVGKVSAQMIKKIEELTLYVIGQEKAINNLKIQNEQLQSRMSSLVEKGEK